MSDEIESQLRPQIETYIRNQYGDLPPTSPELLEKMGLTREEWREKSVELHVQELLPSVVEVWQEKGAQGEVTEEIFFTASIRSSKAKSRQVLDQMAERVPQMKNPERRRIAEGMLSVFQRFQPAFEAGAESLEAVDENQLKAFSEDFSDALIAETKKLRQQNREGQQGDEKPSD